MSRPTEGRHDGARGNSADALAVSYGTLFARLLPGVTGSGLLDHKLGSLGKTGSLDLPLVTDWLTTLGWNCGRQSGGDVVRELPGGSCIVAFPYATSQSDFLGAACIAVPARLRAQFGSTTEVAAREVLGPALDCLRRELARLSRVDDVEPLTLERTRDLEWLFNVAGDLKRDRGDSNLLRKLLTAACERMECPLGMICIPDKQLSILQSVAGQVGDGLRDSAILAETHLLAWATRRGEPLMVNEPPRAAMTVPPVKFLSVPVRASAGRVLGFLAFFRAPDAAGFSEREQYLAGHVARQVIQLVESQFDLMTGLPTRTALERSYESLCVEAPSVTRSIVYLDIDELHVCNETHGFELGDEVIVRVAQALTSGLVAGQGLVGRISADSFALIVDNSDPRDAAAVAARVQEAVRRIRIGPAADPVKVSVSCGVAAIVDMPKGFKRALAAAELACKTAKDRGRDRVEVYACEDASMMRRHDDVIVVGQLREAIRSDRLVLFVQPIVGLRPDRPVTGYEVLLRMRNEDGSLTSAGDFISAAQRYQLLPQIDRFVLKRALEIAAPFRGVLREMKLSLSINVSGQSIGDESFVDFVLKTLKETRLPPGLMTCEITEQTAVSSLAKAAQTMSRLRAAGCGVALDDFGVGANTFAYLKGLPATRIKIDGSFVRDMLTNSRSAAMVNSLVELAKQFGLETVAEYVESEELAAALERIGVEHAQGYAFGRPEDMESVLKSLRDDESRRMRALWLEA